MKSFLMLMAAATLWICPLSSTVANAQTDETVVTAEASTTTPQNPSDGVIDHDHNEFRTRLLPSFYLDFDHGRRVINLTKYDTRNGHSDALVYGEYRDGFKVVDFCDLEGGIGPALNFYFANSTGLKSLFWAEIGLVPIVGREVVSVRYARNIAALNRMEKMKAAPIRTRDLRVWSMGDAATFASKGGVVFQASVGLPGIGVGTEIVAKGEFQTYVEKMDESTAYVRLSDLQIDSVALQLQANLASIGVKRYREVATAFGFKLDISSPLGQKAYWDLLRGNISPVQKMASLGANGPVQRWDKVDSNKVGSFHTAFVGLPILVNMMWSKGQLQDLVTSHKYYNNTDATGHYGIYVREKRSNFFSHKKTKTEAFYGAAVRVVSAQNEELMKDHFGQYVWSWDNSHTKPGRLQEAMQELVRKTGLRKDVLLRIPEVPDLEYTSVDLRVTFDEAQTIHMMETSRSEGRLSDRASRRVHSYFRHGNDPNEVCYDHSRNLETCEAQLEEETSNAAREMASALAQMKSAFDAGFDAAFARAYGLFGRAMSENQFTFQLALQLAGPGVEADYMVQGQNILAYLLALETSEDATEMRRVDREVVDSNPIGEGKSTRDHNVIVEPGPAGKLDLTVLQ